MITNNLNDLSAIDFANGEVILIDKEKGKTSFNAVHRIRAIAKVKKVGHAGTLDPLATGLLIICTGKKTKEISSYQDLQKTYTGIIKLGQRTASMDSETEVLEEKSLEYITPEKIEEVRKSFLGEQFQKPPMYSAVKHKGKALYKYARKGVEVEREFRKIIISEFNIISTKLPELHFEIKCSKGTYIRVIADDFGTKLGCGAYLQELRRTAIGDYKVNDALTVNEFNELFKNVNT
ncbi:MAG: tRNA pseudouridine(55) synthase TruB [Melioribacteraceae bacterium]|nr:tRNA pseudouridine(55) synthase TruB [Melioribacteraceae bacterium]MCF8355848.1 tRNA pseudouridine(55) synthase TruB [Melioribacteraceae bacterium]MCF8392577.1 tRNA pseudouridine(55) synthase TruB [Melioribacteraceae bacterium]MCF8418551.1 tRNA pseudouridine(55) synthase TruB [Melioribacteraceae bacterium]